MQLELFEKSHISSIFIHQIRLKIALNNGKNGSQYSVWSWCEMDKLSRPG